MQSTHNWNFEEFTTFLLRYAAEADLSITKDEEDFMKSRIDTKSYDKVAEVYNASSDYEKVQIILSYKGLYYPTIDRRNELLALIKKQFLADGDYSLLEKNVMRLLEKLM